MARKRGRKIGEVERDPKSFAFVDKEGNVYEKKRRGKRKRKIGEVKRDPKSIAYVTKDGTVKEIKRKTKERKPKKAASKRKTRAKKLAKPKTTIAKKGTKADILSANPQNETVKIRTVTETKEGKRYGSRTYNISAKHGLSPKRVNK